MPEVTGTVSSVEEEAGCTKPQTNGTVENGISSTSPEKKSPEKNEGEILLAQGKRHLFIKDYSNAVATLGDACAKLSEMFGELADECVDAYFSYGRALLELAREESNVLGTEPEKENSEEEEEDGEEEGENKPKDEAEDDKTPSDQNAEEEKLEENTSEEKETEESPADETIDTTKIVEDGEDGADEEKEEDVDNLQLAWEVFELAKKIYERQNSDAKLAETYLYLGEVALESENYNNAIEDMKRCVEIQKQILPPDHRDIAETYFQLGVACSLCNEFDEAIMNFQTSSDVLEMRIKNLEEKGAPEGETERNPFYSVEKEVAEIKALLPEIKAKISDMEDFKQETIKGVMETLKEKPQSSDGAGPSSAPPIANGSTPKPATDISHLVRKKRKPEEDTSSEPVVKKACTTEVKK
uniref:Tetratricopeptide SHNi-TPR domain-containing protein n=1 Tax=Homalodisca liturata TaxID=320908 RepID=A0A1B6IXI9_9HEMI